MFKKWKLDFCVKGFALAFLFIFCISCSHKYMSAEPVEVSFQDIKDEREAIARYPFLKDLLKEDKKNTSINEIRIPTEISVGFINNGPKENFLLLRLAGPLHCGNHGCEVRAYLFKDNIYVPVDLASVNGPRLFSLRCNKDTALVLTGPGRLSDSLWVYRSESLAFVFSKSYEKLSDIRNECSQSPQK